jgi:RNA polymerase sigma-70 factor (ECF subfamily)
MTTIYPAELPVAIVFCPGSERFSPRGHLTPSSTVTRTAIALPTPLQVNESELIARVLAGDRLAGRELYDAHAARVFRLAYRLTGDAELAREFTQDTFVRAFQRLADFRGEAAFSTWIHRITITVVANAMRKVRRLRERETDLTDLDAHDPAHASTRRLDPDLRERLAKAIDALPEIYRTTLIMHDMEGYTHTEIAGVLGVAEGTCKSRLSAARAQLRAALADFAKEYES